jgi:putative hydrolase of the HAD superfamily
VFDTVTISAEVGAIKPEAKIYQVALEQARVKAEEAVFVDDVNINLEGCEDLGMTGILFKNPQDSIAELKRLLEEHT